MENIVLIGMSGSGKSTVGQYIARKLNIDFLDTDDIIVSNTEKSIEYIFSHYGEIYFRELEKLVINSLGQRGNMVIATGGGIVLNSDNLEKLKNNGIIFLLQGSVETLYKNINFQNSINDQRPLLKQGDLKVELERMYNNREELYLKSGDYKISIDNKTINEIGNEIISIYKKNNTCS